MTLATTEWLPAPDKLPVALLIHGIGNTSAAWWRLAEHLTDLGYRVVAPDLTGHGDSPRAESYAIENWVEDVLLTLRAYPSPSLIVGHSLGGLIATGVATRLPQPPKRVILIDPAWLIPVEGAAKQIMARILGRMSDSTAETMQRTKPTWSGRDITLELAAIKKWDPKTVWGLDGKSASSILRAYLKARIPTTLVRPRNSIMVLGFWGWLLQHRHGVEVLSMPRASHTLHRDDPAAFLKLVQERLVPEIVSHT